MKSMIKTFLVSIVLVFAAATHANEANETSGSGVDALSGFYERVDSFQANFVQMQRDEEGDIFQESAGEFLLSRPDRFRWEYQTPYAQIIASDGKAFRFYDVDLDQVTVRDVDGTLRATPALLLSGGAALEDEFSIFSAGERDGLAWVKLVPNDNEGDFSEIRMGLDGDVPKRMELDDNLGQTTEIQFSDIEVNHEIATQRYNIEIPEGVEVVDARAVETQN